MCGDCGRKIIGDDNMPAAGDPDDSWVFPDETEEEKDEDDNGKPE